MENFKIIKDEFVKNLSSGALKKIILSNPLDKKFLYSKILVNPKKNDSGVFYQLTYYYETKVKHENYFDVESASEKIFMLFKENYKQCDMVLQEQSIKILSNKSKNFKIRRTGKPITDKHKDQEQAEDEGQEIKLSGHNQIKHYILEEGRPIEWLVALGIMNQEGRIIKEKQKKFRQINRFLEMISDVYDRLPDEPVIIDFGCGKSYLTFALYYFLEQNNKKATIIGLDLKKDVVAYCQGLAKKFGFVRLNFSVGDIKDFVFDGSGSKIHMVITLHACDTATDYALFNGVKWGSDIILSVPCCQHELFEQIKNESFAPLLKHGILKERFSSLLTDSIRASLLESRGYKTTVMEFIDMEHTPKNIMIRAIRRRNVRDGEGQSQRSLEEFRVMKEMFGVTPKLEELLKELSPQR